MLSAILSLLMGGLGCVANNPRVTDVEPAGAARDWGLDSESGSAPLRVVHVSAESGLRAGAPIGKTRVITIQEAEDEAMPIAVVDGRPLVWYRHPGARLEARGSAPNQFPRFRTLMGWPLEDAEVNAEASALGPRPNEPVLIGGYFIGHEQSRPQEFWKSPPHVVRARVIEPPEHPEEPSRPGQFWIAAPPGDYRGFRGGPVAVEDELGKTVLIGVVLFQKSDSESGDKSEAILTAQTISEGRKGEGP